MKLSKSILCLSIPAILISILSLKYFFTMTPPNAQSSGDLAHAFYIHFSKLIESSPWIFYGHIIGSSIALIVGWLQFSIPLRTKHPAFHRSVGILYICSSFVGGIAGVMIALQALGGPISQTGFTILGVGWLITIGMGLFSIKQKKIKNHENWMIRSYSLAFAGVMLRLLNPLFILAGIEPMQSYRLLAWISWIPNIIFAEWLIRKRNI